MESKPVTIGTLRREGKRLWVYCLDCCREAEIPASDHPFILAQNEGFNIAATVPATGTWRFSVQVEWEELASY